MKNDKGKMSGTAPPRMKRPKSGPVIDSAVAARKTMREMEESILESRRKLPKASLHLDNISAQTEAAAHQMLEKVEQIIEQQSKIGALSDEISRLILKSPNRGDNEIANRIAGIRDIANDSQNDAFLIMDTLQFQDITSQQARHISEMLDDIEHRLHFLQNLLCDADSDERADLNHPDPDDDACRVCSSGKDQKEVDAIVSRIGARKR